MHENDDLCPLHRLMISDVRRTAGMTTCCLTRLWLIITNEVEIQPVAWEVMLGDYIDRCRSNLDSVKANNLRGNLRRSLSKDAMSWKIFVRGLSVIFRYDCWMQLTIDRGGDICVVKAPIHKIYTDTVTPSPDGIIEGSVLRTAWREILGYYKIDNINTLIRKYAKNFKSVSGAVPSNLPSGLRAEAMTWANFDRGLTTLEADTIKVEVFANVASPKDTRRVGGVTLTRSY